MELSAYIHNYEGWDTTTAYVHMNADTGVGKMIPRTIGGCNLFFPSHGWNNAHFVLAKQADILQRGGRNLISVF